SDANGVYDHLEAGPDADGDGIADACDRVIVDTDGDGIADTDDLDDDNDGIYDTSEGNQDTDGDGIPDSLDTDSDNDGCSDAKEAGFTDADSDGEVDGTGYNADGTVADSDGYVTPLDANDNGIFDYKEVGPDSDNDGIADACDNDSDDDDTDNDFDDVSDPLPTDIECLTVYSLFTPNGDGINDTFEITCLDQEQYKDNRLEIYNRWGSLVYSKEEYDNSWDGTSNASLNVQRDSKLPAGTYFYVLDLGDGIDPKVGWVYINRE
ncbi:gliding motility-associated C-terminal domain-containing protein, partial [Tenacibaculum sp. SG-28]|uniref:gliding motility-associated C-terminal domain-containing protein n=1 Tax=Tenacibaculum sp. SG-28 TaxID=754426 RepID=UPI000D46DD94